MAVTNLRLRMIEDGRKQGDIARAAGMPASRLSEYALGRKKAIPHHHLIALSVALRCNPQEIQGYAEEIVL